MVPVLGDIRIDTERLAASLVRASPGDHARTHYREIRRVPSASVLRVRRDGVAVGEDTPFAVRPDRDAPVDALAAELRDRMVAAVERAIHRAAHVGVLVSGGVDSSALLAIAVAIARRAGKRVTAFNLHFADEGDDRPHLQSVCSMLGVVPVHVPPRECGSALPDALVIDRVLAGWVSAPSDVGIARVASRHGVDVLLTGIGGDEIFGGDTRIFAQAARDGRLLEALRAAATLKAWGESTTASRIRSLVARPLLRGLVPRPLLRRLRAARRRRRAPVWAGRGLERLFADGALEFGNAVDVDERPTERSWLAAVARSGLYMYVSEARAQLEIAGGCPRADPFLDDDVVEFLASLRPELLFHGGWTRGLLRHAMRGLVPETIRLRADKGHFERAFLEVVEAAGGFGVLAPLVSMTGLGDLGLVDPPRFRERFDELARNPANGFLWTELWPVLAAEAFVRQAPRA
jgi:asparagine synthase (glutamine-hydrolysing)